MGLDRNERHPLLCRASNEITSIRNSLPFGMAAEHHPRPRWPNLYLPLVQQCFGFVPIFTRGLASTPWYGTSKVHHEQLRRIGRQSSKLQFIRIRIDAKQLIVVNMLTCSGVPGGGIFGSKHSSNKIVLRKNLDSKPRMIGSIKRHFCTPTEPLSATPS